MALIIIFTLLCLSSIVIIAARRVRLHQALKEHYIHSIIAHHDRHERYLDSVAALSSDSAKNAAAEAVATLSPIIYRFEGEELTHITDSLHLADFLIDKALQSRGARRTHALVLLAQIPDTKITKQQLAPFATDKDRMVRFFALIITINTDAQKRQLHPI